MPSIAELRAQTQPDWLLARPGAEHWAGRLYMRRLSPYLTRLDKAALEARIDALATEASVDAPFAHLWLEPARRAPQRDHEFLVVLELWPDGGRRVLGTAHPHGVPAIWE